MQKSNCNSKPKDDDDSELESMSRASSPSSLEGGSNLDKSFPTILYGIISDESSNDCINWHPGGRQFVITDKDKFSKKILPTYFGSRGTTKYTSFTRRLKRWKFARISKGPRLGAYYHEFFVKDQPELLAKIFYPGRRKPASPSSKNDISKGKRASKARRRASTGSSVQPVVNQSDVQHFSSFSKPVQDSVDRERLNISPMPYSLELSSESPKLLTKDFTNWLSDTTFEVDDHDHNNLLSLDLSSPPAGPVSVISDSSITETPATGIQMPKPFILPRRHSCIASISSSPCYNEPLNDVSDKACGNAQIESMLPRRPISSLNRLVTNNNLLPSARQQLYENLQESKLQHFDGGSVVNASQHQATLNRSQQLQRQTNNQRTPRQQLHHFVGGVGSSSLTKLTAEPEQKQQHKAEEQEQDQQRAQLSRYLDELDVVFRFSE